MSTDWKTIPVPTQIHLDGMGWGDCAEVCGLYLARIAGTMPAAGETLGQIEQMSQAMRGQPDGASDSTSA